MIDLGALVAKIVVDSGDSKQQLESFGTQVENADGKSFNLSGTLKKLAAGFTIGVAIKKTADVVVDCVKKADELKQSFNTLQTQTGATDEEMEGLEESLKNIYANNFGENFEDIATAIAEVKNQTGLAGDELEAMTENAIALRDTFGYEVQESTRAADMMMKQFGITSEEAFNLIAQGSQYGLDKNGNLLDSINEYSVHFEQLGFTAEDMFNVFHDGAMEGVFDIDKVGDAFKEFGIRVKDGSDTTNEAFSILGLNAQEMQDKFSQGGDSAQEAYWKVAEALNSIDDPVQRNIAGVNLFGTMWEDMGDKAILSAMEMSDYFNGTVDTMNQIKEIKYDDLGSAFEGIGRQMETGLMIPLGEKLLPLVNEFANWINENMPQIQEVFGAVMETIGSLIDGLVQVIKALVTEAQTEGTYFNAVWENIKIFMDTTFNAIREILNIFTALFQGDWEGFWEGIKNLAVILLDGIVKAIENAGKFFLNAGKSIFTFLWDGVKSVWDDIKSWVEDKVEWLTDKLTFWRKSKKEMSEDNDDSDGSHRNGLSYVPFDGYNAVLHRKEMVLTAAEADRYRNGENGGNKTENFTVNIAKVENNNGRTAGDLMREMEFYRKSKKLATGGA